MSDFTSKYPYTDFHELNLDWFLSEFKKTVDKVTTLEQTVSDFIDYVNNWIDSQDVPALVQEQIQQLIDDGTMASFIQPWFDMMVSQQNDKIAVLEARMDEFTNLPYGSVSTAADAELVDIRIGADGYTWPNAGDAVRGQVEKINRFIDFDDDQIDLAQVFGTHTDETRNNVTFTWSADKKTCTVNGSTNASLPGFTYVFSSSTIRWPFTMGDTITIAVESTNPNLYVQLVGYYNGSITSDRLVFQNGVTTVAIPNTSNTFTVRLFAAEGNNTFTNDTISFRILSGMESYQLNGLNTSIYDMTSEIKKRLDQFGVCQLGTGIYYVNELDMPAGSMLRGVGDATIIRIAPSATYGIRMANNTTVKDLLIEGNNNDITLGATVQDRHAILWQGDYDATLDKMNQPTNGKIENVTIRRMTGGAITCDNTGPDVGKGLNVSDCYITNCNAAINIAYLSEFHRFTNVNATYNYYACVNNGGNNTFTSCNFSNNKVGMILKMVDGSGRTISNPLHGSAIGCVFNHIDRDNVTLGKGDAVHFEKSGAGFTFTGCQFWYSKVYIEDCAGISFSGCQFGLCKDAGGVDHGYYINLVNSSNNNMHEYFMNNTFSNQPDITKTNTGTAQIKVHVDLSFTRSGVAITA